jgi:hypothetical protein
VPQSVSREERSIVEKRDLMSPTGLWDIGVAVLIAAVVCCGEFFFSVDQVLSAANSPNFAFAYGERANPWAQAAIAGEAARDTQPAVHRASLDRPARTPTF